MILSAEDIAPAPEKLSNFSRLAEKRVLLQRDYGIPASARSPLSRREAISQDNLSHVSTVSRT